MHWPRCMECFAISRYLSWSRNYCHQLVHRLSTIFYLNFTIFKVDKKLQEWLRDKENKRRIVKRPMQSCLNLSYTDLIARNTSQSAVVFHCRAIIPVNRLIISPTSRINKIILQIILDKFDANSETFKNTSVSFQWLKLRSTYVRSVFKADPSSHFQASPSFLNPWTTVRWWSFIDLSSGPCP